MSENVLDELKKELEKRKLRDSITRDMTDEVITIMRKYSRKAHSKEMDVETWDNCSFSVVAVVIACLLFGIKKGVNIDVDDEFSQIKSHTLDLLEHSKFTDSKVK